MLHLDALANHIIDLVKFWEPKLLVLDNQISVVNRNSQSRNIKQIVGHMVDSASNNTHRIIHFHYQSTPISFPDYANLGNNDRWIAVQHYENENWNDLVNLWKYTHLHIAHVIKNVDASIQNKIWISAANDEVTLAEMITDFPRHMELHLKQIDELIAIA